MTTSQGSPYSRLRRALDHANITRDGRVTSLAYLSVELDVGSTVSIRVWTAASGC